MAGASVVRSLRLNFTEDDTVQSESAHIEEVKKSPKLMSKVCFEVL